MRAWLAASAAMLLLTAALTTASADEPLKVCLDEDLPPLSVHHRGKPDSGALNRFAASQSMYSSRMPWSARSFRTGR